jgi:pSer/pThr/pTyr-binding forkhead associated (FHA) protein
MDVLFQDNCRPVQRFAAIIRRDTEHRLPVYSHEVVPMKVSLVVAQGVHAGKVIPIATSQFLIGRDAHCNLRPQSQAISKQHAGVFIRDGKVFLKDYGSTNGSFVNGEQVVDEREIKHDDQLKIGPLDFVLHVDLASPSPTVKQPAPATAAQPKPAAVKPAPAKPVPVPATPTPTPAPVSATAASSEEALAAMLLMDDGAIDSSADRTAEQSIPDGTTVVEIPAIPDDPKKAADLLQKVKEAAKNNSQAAGDLLRKYMNRPRSQG